MRIINPLSGRSLHPRLKTQLVASFLIISILMSAISYIIVYYGILNILEKQNEDSTLQQFRQSDYNIGNLMGDVDKVSKILINEASIQDWLDRKYGSEFEKFGLLRNVNNKLSEIFANYEYIDSIYLYKDNGYILGAAGDSRYYYIEDAGQQNWFYHSDLYKEANEGNHQLLWYGFYCFKDFDFSDSGSSRSNDYHILTSARKIRSLQYSEINATLVINIREKDFLSIYNNSNTKSNNTMYIVDRQGRIISHSKQELIGSLSDLKRYVNKTGPKGSFTFERKFGMMQVVYYKLQAADWILVNEVPFNVFISNILQLREILVIVALASLMLVFLMSLYWIYKITKPLDGLLHAMNQLQKGELGVELNRKSGNEFDVLSRQFNRMSKSIVDLIHEVKAIEKEKRRHEIETLQAQINPHFLYNTLNTIKWMAIAAGQDHISDSLTALGNLLKPIFKSSSIQHTINEEIEYITHYIKLMNCRYGECITLQCDIHSTESEYLIPRFILQPIVENSIVHGISGVSSRIDISVTVHVNFEKLFILICDNGKGIPAEKLSEIKNSLLSEQVESPAETKSIGIFNVNKRIKLQYGEDYGIDVDCIPGGGTKIEAVLPLVQKS